jgi:hypothetical protein
VFSATETNVDGLAVTERKAAQKNLHLVQFTGSSPGSPTAQWVRLLVNAHERRGSLVEWLDLDLRRLPDRLGLLVPEGVFDPDSLGQFERGDPAWVERWAGDQRRDMRGMLEESRFDRGRTIQMIEDVKRVEGQPLILIPGGEVHTLRGGDLLGGGTTQPLFLRVEGPSEPMNEMLRHEFTVAFVRQDC